MNPRISAALLGSTLLLNVSPAAAATIEWSDPGSRAIQIAWSSQSADALRERLAVRSARVTDDGSRDDRVGPTGGVLLHSYNGIAIELRSESGLVQAVKRGDDGRLIVRVLFDAFAAGPQVFARGGDTQVMVTMSVCREATGAGLLQAGQRTKRVKFQFDVVIYDGSPGGEILDQVSLAYDASTLKPAITSSEARTFTDAWYTAYWNAAPSEAPSASSRARERSQGNPVAQQARLDATFYTPPAYWLAAAPTGSWYTPYWGPTAEEAPTSSTTPRTDNDPAAQDARNDPAPGTGDPLP